MTPAFSYDVDPDRDLIRATLSGFFTVNDVGDFIAARDVAHRQLRCRIAEHLTLVDIREMHIQAKESVAEFHAMLADPRAAGQAIAFVVSQSLARMQAQRIAGERRAEFFTSIDAAEGWLMQHRRKIA